MKEHDCVPTATPIEVIRRRTRMKLALEDTFLHEATQTRDRTAIKRFLARLTAIEFRHPRTTRVGALRSGRFVTIWIFEPHETKLGACESLILPWHERFRAHV